MQFVYNYDDAHLQFSNCNIRGYRAHLHANTSTLLQNKMNILSRCDRFAYFLIISGKQQKERLWNGRQTIVRISGAKVKLFIKFNQNGLIIYRDDNYVLLRPQWIYAAIIIRVSDCHLYGQVPALLLDGLV